MDRDTKRDGEEGYEKEGGGGFLRQFRRSRLSNFVTVINKVYTTTPYQPHSRRGVNSLDTSLFVFTPLDGAVGVNYRV